MVERWPLSEYRQTINTATDCISLQPRLLRSATYVFAASAAQVCSVIVHPGAANSEAVKMILFILAAF